MLGERAQVVERPPTSPMSRARAKLLACLIGGSDKKRWFLCRNYANMTEGQFAALKLALGGEATGFGTTPLLIDDEDL